ncbi:helix-turn-helix domain-containing protein [Nocardia sp. NPDC050793]|uniref:TetR/AcrR family transcriptional regulator n=1 Tax=Nocardia sp. NPDC050793 TaxID=3155159 RepID=UPI0033FB2721
MSRTSRERIIDEALRLFGEQGFARTSVAQIERAAGLSGGSGALYRHFRSKDELLVEAVRTRLTERAEWEAFLDPDFSFVALLDAATPGGTVVDRLLALCRVGLERLNHDRDVTRILMRDNSIDRGVLEVFRREEYGVVMSVVTRALTQLAGPGHGEQDWTATAAVLVGALAHFWLIRDIFDGDHPASVDEDRYLRATAELVAARVDWAGHRGEEAP